jgi:hypothetical protein
MRHLVMHLMSKLVAGRSALTHATRLEETPRRQRVTNEIEVVVLFRNWGRWGGRIVENRRDR